MLGDLEAEGEVLRSELAADRMSEVVFDVRDARRRCDEWRTVDRDGARSELGEGRRPPALPASDVHDRARVHEVLDDDRDGGCATGRARTDLRVEPVHVRGRLRRRAHGGMAAVEQEPWVDAPPAASLECLDTLAKRRRVPQQALVLGHEIELVHVGTIRLEMLA